MVAFLVLLAVGEAVKLLFKMRWREVVIFWREGAIFFFGNKILRTWLKTYKEHMITLHEEAGAHRDQMVTNEQTYLMVTSPFKDEPHPVIFCSGVLSRQHHLVYQLHTRWPHPASVGVEQAGEFLEGLDGSEEVEWSAASPRG